MALPDPRPLTIDGGAPVQIRPARPSDARGWLDLLQEVSREERFILLESVSTSRRELARIFRFGAWCDQTAAIVAVEGSRIVGQLTITRNRNIYQHTAEIGMSVQRDYRGRGIGATLIRGAEDWARRFRVEKLVLNVVPGNVKAIRFYERMGFVAEGHRVRQAKLSYGYEDLVEMGLWVHPE